MKLNEAFTSGCYSQVLDILLAPGRERGELQRSGQRSAVPPLRGRPKAARSRHTGAGTHLAGRAVKSRRDG